MHALSYIRYTVKLAEIDFFENQVLKQAYCSAGPRIWAVHLRSTHQQPAAASSQQGGDSAVSLGLESLINGEAEPVRLLP